MRLLLIDIEHTGLDLALRAAHAGHEVRLYRHHDKGPKPTYGDGFGLFKLVGDWKSSMSWAKDGLILLTGNYKFLPELDRYRDHGFKIFAPSVKSAELEINRGVGMKALEKLGIDVPPYRVFDSLPAAEAAARKANDPFVFKPMGDEEDKSLTYCASDPADLVGWLQNKIKRGAKLKGQCMLQEKIDMLCDYGCSSWFGPEGFLPNKIELCWEHKKLMDGEIGPQTGETGTLAQYVESDKLATDMLLPFAPLLKKLGHRGDFSIGVGVDKKGKAWPFEFTARLGWPAFFLQTASHLGDPIQWMRDLLDGRDSLQVNYDPAMCIVMASPRWPYGENDPAYEGNPITLPDDVSNVHLANVRLGTGPIMATGKIVDGAQFQTAGEYTLVATGLAPSINQARTAVYGVVEQIKFADAMYRTDIGTKVLKILPQLHKFGYALDMK